MILSASRRTDIPAFYAEWMCNRIKAGYCTVFNPFNRNQVKYVSLNPNDLDLIVFWTKNSIPLRPHLHLMDEREIKYYFQYTLTRYSREIETRVPSFDILQAEFIKLAEHVGPGRIIWRYDPIIISKRMSFQSHIDNFGSIANKLKGLTNRVVISLVDYYEKTVKNMSEYANNSERLDHRPETREDFPSFVRHLVKISLEHHFEIQSCAEPIELGEYGIVHGKCIDDELVRKIFGKDVTHKKDPGQRNECGCVKSIDIGVYDTCLHGCQYCYATKNHNAAKQNYETHDPTSPSLVGWYEAQPPTETDSNDDQLSLNF